jgi:hypothetical protein
MLNDPTNATSTDTPPINSNIVQADIHFDPNSMLNDPTNATSTDTSPINSNIVQADIHFDPNSMLNDPTNVTSTVSVHANTDHVLTTLNSIENLPKKIPRLKLKVSRNPGIDIANVSEYEVERINGFKYFAEDGGIMV